MANNSQNTHQQGVLKVIVSGGGPVGLSFALLLNQMMGNTVSIIIYDGRWTEKEGQVVWKTAEAGNSRRQQVVTIQSRQYLKYPQAVQDRIFQKEAYSEMWPESADSINGYGPRNVRISHIENCLLEIANEQKDNIKLIPARFNAKEQRDEIEQHHVLAICEGGGSRSREFFIDQFGKESKSMYSLNGEHLQDVVLGLRVKSELSDPMSILLTVTQNRFLLNSLRGNGFLNMRLTDEEVKEVVGIDLSSQELKLKVCIQAQPCLMECSDKPTNFGCATHGTLFLPALLKSSPLWLRIQEGLKLFNVKPENLTAVTAFRLDMVQRPRFTVQLYPSTPKTLGTFGCLLGDAANAIHFWSGRGLNNGIATAVSLARCLKQQWRGRSFREADFTRHEGLVSMLQYRHKSRGWQTMVDTDADGKTSAIKDIIAQGIIEAEQGVLDKGADIAILMTRLQQVRTRLQQRVKGLPSDQVLQEHLATLDAKTLRTLVVSKPWNMGKVGGEEVDVDLLFEETEGLNIAKPSTHTSTPTSDNPLLFAALIYDGDEKIHHLNDRFDITIPNKSLKIGRGQENDLCIEDMSVSRQHALINFNEKQALMIEDIGSTGGTYLNGEKLEPHQPKKLKHNDKISFSTIINYTIEISS
ncbi:MAG: FHA domain-containing protein [Cocleimonas sp.]|nr:FHA domain-containing protein [Cocleimonas sp.]